jgi:endonuclease G
MSWERHISDDDVREVRQAAIEAGLAKDAILDALLAGLDPTYVSMLSGVGLPPAAKLSVQLHAMNRVANLRNGDVPLAQWLRAAKDFSGDQPAATVFERALLKTSVAASTPPQGAKSMNDGAANANLTVRPEVQVSGSDNTLPIKYLKQALVATASVFKVLVHRHSNGLPVFLSGDLPHLVNGTGWLIAPKLLITNHHVINARMRYPVSEADASPEDFVLQAENTTILFDYFETDKPSAKISTAAGALLAFDKALDFAILRVPDAAPQRLPLRLRRHPIRKTLVEALGTRVNILQHPNGNPMRLGFRENFVVFGDDASLTYLTDTAVGSSGSPVTDDGWSVAALHAGSQNISDKNITLLGKPIGSENFGVPVPAIMAKLQSDKPAVYDEITNGQPQD